MIKIDKCICGFVHKVDYDDDKNSVGKPFKKIVGRFFENKGYCHHEEIFLVACPKCGTIKISDMNMKFEYPEDKD